LKVIRSEFVVNDKVLRVSLNPVFKKRIDLSVASSLEVSGAVTGGVSTESVAGDDHPIAVGVEAYCNQCERNDTSEHGFW